MDTFDAHFERVEPPPVRSWSVLSIPIVQSYSNEDSLVIEITPGRHCRRDIVFFADSLQEHIHLMSDMPSEQLGVETQFCIDINCRIKTILLPLVSVAVSSIATRFGCISGGSPTLSDTGVLTGFRSHFGHSITAGAARRPGGHGYAGAVTHAT